MLSNEADPYCSLLLYTALKDSVHGGLVLQARLKGYLDAISLTVDEGGVEIGAANDRDWTTVA